jgi:GDP-4-dehydro-6-deoxy-D-mannose reductase
MEYLITGSKGLIGGYLLDRLRAENRGVHGLSRGEEEDGQGQAGYDFHGDICSPERMRTVLQQCQPDVIFHCAAQSYPRTAWAAPRETFVTNASGTLNLLQAVTDLGLSPRVVICSSSAVYGSGNGEDPIREDHALETADPYGLSKICQEEIGRYFSRVHDLDVVLVRPFFVIGPGKTGDVCSDFAREIVGIEAGNKEPISVGNLDVYRDFLDIEDAIEAMLLLSRRGMGGEAYNICSGHAQSIQSILDMLVGHSSKAKIAVSVAETKQRINDLTFRIGCCEKLKSLGWSPKVSTATSLLRILQYWREQDYTILH